MNDVISLYDRLAEYYPFIFKLQNPNSDILKEVNFLETVFKANKMRPKKILDLGCGSGRLTTALQEEGYDTTGIDGSANMIKLARKLHPKSNFLFSEMENIQLKADLAISWWTTYNYLSLEQMKKLSVSLNDSVEWIILDSSNYSIDKRPVSMETNFEDKKADIKIAQLRKWHMAGNKRTLDYIYEIYKKGKLKDKLHLLDISYWYSLNDLKIIFKDNFNLVEAYGDYDSTKKYESSISPRLITLWKRK